VFYLAQRRHLSTNGKQTDFIFRPSARRNGNRVRTMTALLKSPLLTFWMFAEVAAADGPEVT
jgi:hypothetical protein